MTILIRGAELTTDQQALVFSRFGYRWTTDNDDRESNWAHVEVGDRPRIPLTSDEEWLWRHAFTFVNDGSRLAANERHASPAYLAEVGSNPLTPKHRDAMLTFNIGTAPKLTHKTTVGSPGPEFRDWLALTIAEDRAVIDAKIAAAHTRGQGTPICVATNKPIAHGQIYVDQGMKYWTVGGLQISESTAFLLASGDLSFQAFERLHPFSQQRAERFYCDRCGGTGEWSRKRVTKRKCPNCDGEGLSETGRQMEALASSIVWTAAQVAFLQTLYPQLATSVNELLLTGRLHCIATDTFVAGSVLETLYHTFFVPYWLEASPAQLATRDQEFLDRAHQLGDASMTRESVSQLLDYFKARRIGVASHNPTSIARRGRRVEVD